MVVRPEGEPPGAGRGAALGPGAGGEVPDCPGRAWMQAFKEGDSSAFDKIVLHYRSAVRRFIHRYVQDPERVEDLSQETFLRVFRARERYQPTAAFRTWLFTIATRLCLNDLRSRRREKKVIAPISGAPDGEASPDFLEGLPDLSPESAEEALQRRELEEAVDRAIAELPPQQRAAILLLRFEDLSYAEIAEALEISVMAVKSLVHRGREGLRERLERFLRPSPRCVPPPPPRGGGGITSALGDMNHER